MVRALACSCLLSTALALPELRHVFEEAPSADVEVTLLRVHEAGFDERHPVSVYFKPGIFGHHRVGRAADIYGVGGIAISTNSKLPLVCTGTINSTFDSRKIKNPQDASFYFEVRVIASPYPDSSVWAGWVPSSLKFDPPFSRLSKLELEKDDKTGTIFYRIDGKWNPEENVDCLVPLVVVQNCAVTVIRLLSFLG